MTKFETHTVETAPDGSKKILQGSNAKNSFVPNILANMATSPALLEGYTTLAGIFVKTGLSATEREVIMMTVNRLNGCTYCMAAHSTIARKSGVAETVIDALRAGTAIEDAKLEALQTFTETMTEARGWAKDEDVQAFLEAGYTKQNVLDVILGISFKVMSNYTNHITHSVVDDAFSADTWAA